MRAVLAVLLLCVACSSPANREDCSNGKDDDGNGKVDCDDPDCKGTPVCFVDAGQWGTCGKCGNTCTKQSDCWGTNVLDERPIPQCGTGKCQVFNKPLRLRIDYNATSWGGAPSSSLGVITTRWISKIAIDGRAVSCAELIAAAPSPTEPLQLETSGRFTLLGFDSTRVTLVGASVPSTVTIPFVYTGSGSNYVIFTEAWSGGIDSTTHLPNSMRRGRGCVDTGVDVAPISTADDCESDAGTCRTLRPPLPAPCATFDAGC